MHAPFMADPKVKERQKNLEEKEQKEVDKLVAGMQENYEEKVRQRIAAKRKKIQEATNELDKDL